MSGPETDTENPLPVEDDWFAAPEQEDRAPYEETPPADHWDEPEEPEPDEGRGPGDNRPLLIGLGVVAVIVLIIVGVLVARAVSGSDGDGTATTATTATTPATTPPATTQPPAATTTEPATPPAATPPPPASAALPADATLRPGDTGEEVTALQEALISLGYEVGEPDGDYGPATQQAVIAFQQASGLTADGVAGPETLAALAEALQRG